MKFKLSEKNKKRLRVACSWSVDFGLAPWYGLVSYAWATTQCWQRCDVCGGAILGLTTTWYTEGNVAGVMPTYNPSRTVAFHSSDHFVRGGGRCRDEIGNDDPRATASWVCSRPRC